MTYEQELHLEHIKHSFCELADSKYRQGQAEHGGDLWKKKGLIDQAIAEAIDQVEYLITLKQQIEETGIELGTQEDI